jgi:hypothetical protein
VEDPGTEAYAEQGPSRQGLSVAAGFSERGATAGDWALVRGVWNPGNCLQDCLLIGILCSLAQILKLYILLEAR